MTDRSPSDVIDPGTRKVRVLSEMCATCIFRPGNRMNLPDGRTEQVIDANLADEALLTCHDTLPYGNHPDFGPAVCAGFWAKHRDDVLTGRLAQQMGVTRVAPPGVEDA